MSDINSFASSSVKDIAVIVPVFSATIAVTYDVGFFWGLDINYFTLFSMTEHIVFAMEALPIALGVSFTLSVGFVAFRAADVRENKKREREMSTLNSQERVKYLEKLISRHSRTAYIGFALSLTSMILVWLTDGPLSVIVAGSCATLHSIGASFYPHQPNILYSPSFLIAYAIVSALLITFTVGIDVQRKFVRAGKVSHMITFEDSEMAGRIVRAGDRGILFYEPGSREISIIRWDKVKRIRTVSLT